jgi:tetratricopeptide (TPR) repeat protein
MKRALILALALALSATAAWVGWECGGPALARAQAPLRLDPRYRRLMALGFREVSADLLWLRAGIAYGEGARGGRLEAGEIAGLINAAVELDPYYYDAYWYGATFLPPREAIALLEKARRRFPHDWKLPEMIGFLYQLHLRDYRTAARYYEQAAALPGHPPYVPSLAGRFYTEEGDLESAIRVLENFYATCERADLKEDFGRRLTQLSNIKLLEDACAEFARWAQRRPRDLAELTSAGILSQLPEDPYGGRYYLTRRGRVACDRDRNGLRG